LRRLTSHNLFDMTPKEKALENFKRRNREKWAHKDPQADLSPKECTSCKITKLRKEFGLCKTNKDGLQAWCVQCFKDRHRKSPRRQMIVNAKGRASRKGLEFDLSEDDLVIPEFCPILGIPIYVGEGQGPNSPSLDRIDNDKGYVKGNVHVVSWRANDLKANASLDELEKLVRFLKKRKDNDTPAHHE
jgi:hypothetical protein